jgi:hypothetical protein
LKTLKYLYYPLLFLIILWLINSCANPVTPTGGPKDTTPPVLLEADPPLSSLNFNSKKIQLTFNEYVQLKDINEQMLISPPMEEPPEFKIKGKSVIIELKEELKDSTTYNIFLGNAIVDITENNPARNFRYVFSTWDVLDSLSFQGKLINAFDLEPVENINIMLYLNNNDTLPFDSLPYFVKPYYLSRTDEQGLFEFNNLVDESFKIFALEDVNRNLIFDQAGEQIAFVDSLVTPYYIEIPAPDTIAPDTTMRTDTLIIYSQIEYVNLDSSWIEIPDYENMPDSLLLDTEFLVDGLPSPLLMHLFLENDSIQRFLKATMENERKLIFVFRQPTINHQITPLNLVKDTLWKLEEINKTKDTVSYWITELIQDSITFKIADDTVVLDTTDVAIVRKSKNKRQQKKEDQKIKMLKFITKKGPPELNLNYPVNFAYPIKSYSMENSLFIEGEDTIPPVFEFTDSLGLKGRFRHKWKESTNYKIIIPDSMFFDISNQTHDTVTMSFRTKALADYGNVYIQLKLANPGKNHIIQLFSNKKIHTELNISESQKLAFEYLTPGDYQLKVIYDDNENGKWDTGDYIYNIQPEKVGFFEKTITVRANWDLEEEWKL